MDLSGKVALITGSGRRIGRTIAVALSARGAAIAVHYRKSADEARDTVAEIVGKGGVAEAFRADLAVAAEIEVMTRAVMSRFGRIDILINCAAVFYRKPFEQLTEDDWDINLNINLKAPFMLARLLGPTMRREGAGKIVNIGDWAGIRPYKDYLPYTVSKSGLIGLTRALAKALAPEVQVNCVALGPILPPQEYDAAEIERLAQATLTKRIGTPEDVAHAVLFLCEGTDFATGSTLMLDGGRLIN